MIETAGAQVRQNRSILPRAGASPGRAWTSVTPRRSLPLLDVTAPVLCRISRRNCSAASGDRDAMSSTRLQFANEWSFLHQNSLHAIGYRNASDLRS
jgi:hypothetical protein